jgi:hypothetical protein
MWTVCATCSSARFLHYVYAGAGNWLVSSKLFYVPQEYELRLLTNMDYEKL